MDVAIVPCLRDNYAYLLIDRASNLAAAIDPVEPKKVSPRPPDATCNWPLFCPTTHHHSDHAGGNAALLASLPAAIPVYAGDPRVQAISHTLADGDTLALGDTISIRAMHTPCHTTGHISYYCTSLSGTDSPVVFTGDTLFLGGCGRFFEGTADQMLASLDKLAALPGETKVYCGHEYTKANLKFGVAVDAANDQLSKRLANLQAVTVPGTIAEELATNVFMRTRVHGVGDAVGVVGGKSDPIAVMAALREAKNEFRA
ncbi:beta-lactamase-like protein [Catenaria anguillulae PL171]|uniref:hydroxyacylglutathione hydrolase n=1 Tax=Catenaria anguillulae PL171 TaxID=765915 RepID=A0A1Y2HGK5_9FUNG|nr:beta-lactamase-like protein [Catenaria anguillulae PL171]